MVALARPLACLFQRHRFHELEAVTFDGEPLPTGVEICSRCGRDRVDGMALAFLNLELHAFDATSGAPYARLTPELADWLDGRRRPLPA